jgi:hypothetical protein
VGRAALVAVAVLGLGACGSGGGGDGVASQGSAEGSSGGDRTTLTTSSDTSVLSGSPDEVIVAAEARTRSIRTGRFEVTNRLRIDDGDGNEVTVELSGTGTFDQGGARHEISMEFGPVAVAEGELTGEPVPDGLSTVVEQIVDDQAVYERYDASASSGAARQLLGAVPRGWIRFGLPDEAESVSLETLRIPASPLGYLDALRGALPKVDDLGPSTIDGEAVRGYSGRIDPELALAAAPSADRAATEQRLVQIGFHRFRSTATSAYRLPFRVWIGPDGLVRRMELSLLREIPDGIWYQPTVSVDYVDPGASAEVSPPPIEDTRSFVESLINREIVAD